MTSEGPDTEELLSQVQAGDVAAQEQLFNRYRDRLRQMIRVRMDPRLARRIDPSDVIQDTLTSASQQIVAYAEQRPLPFYPWLRQIAWQRLVDLHHRHVTTKKRSVGRERELYLSDQSAVTLANRIVGHDTSPTARLLRNELQVRVQKALLQLKPTDREVLVMRHLEQMRVSEIAAVLQLSESAVKMRRLRAVQRLRELLGSELLE